MGLRRHFAPRFLLLGALSLAALAQDAPPVQEDGFDPDSASRGVARLSVMNGEVEVRRGDSGDYVAAAINAPLVVGDRVLTGPGSRTEVQFDWANMIRVGADSEIRMAELQYHRYLVQIARGVATFRVLRASEADVEVSTPQISIRPKKEGVYRVTVREDGETELMIRAGEVEVYTPRGIETLRAGGTMRVRGSASDPEYQIVGAYPDDEWDRWNLNRDRELERSQSYRYVGRDVYGADDLDPYGQWVQDPGYGSVWSPRVAAGWAPYREGRWVWVDWYGWTWVSNDPWGWAPYHYGRWYQNPTYGWCWYPGGGGFGVRRSWSPGLVAFVGFGGGFNNIGWVPLAPHEPYYRWYGRGIYRGGLNARVVNDVNLYNTYRNARFANSVTAIDGRGFVRGGAGRAWRGSDGDIQRASLVRGQLPVAPNRESLRLSEREVRNGIGSRVPETQRFVSRRPPAQVERAAFEQQRRNFEGQRSFSPSRVVAAPERQTNWRRFGDPAPGRIGRVDRNAQRQQQAGQESNGQRGWGRFGEPAGGVVDRGAYRAQQPQAQQQSTAPQMNTPRIDNYRPPEAPAVRQNAAPARQEPAPRIDRNVYSRPNMERNGGPRFASPEAVRISPPVVRERQAAPRMESAPALRSAPRNESPRPSGGNGDGNSGGGGRHEGGGGRSEGGGGGRGRR
jgi:uncharacterized membrane protein YgcG